MSSREMLDAQARAEAQKVGILFAEAMIALSQAIRGRALAPMLDEIGTEIVKRVPSGTVNVKFIFPAVRNLMVRTLDYYR